MQYREVEASSFSLAQTASADVQLTKVKALLRDIQTSGQENGTRLEGIFRTCLLALQQLEERATTLSTELRHRGPFRGGEGTGVLPQATSGPYYTVPEQGPARDFSISQHHNPPPHTHTHTHTPLGIAPRICKSCAHFDLSF